MSMQQKLAEAMTTRYSATIELWAQQEKAVTEGLCDEVNETGVENLSEDFIGTTQMREKNTRDTDLIKSEINFRRRWTFSQPYYNLIACDTDDQLRMRVDPATGIGQAQAAAAMRQKDLTFIAGAIGTTYSGKTFSTANTFPVAGIIDEGDASFTVAKFDKAVRYLRRYGQMRPGDRIWCLWTGEEEKTFGGQLEVASKDYSSISFRDKGKIDSWGLVDFRTLEDHYDEDGALVHRMLPYSANTGTGGKDVRTCLMGVKRALRRWTPGGLGGYVWFNGSKDQYEINTKLNVGVSRRLDRGIVQIPCTTTDPES